MNPAATPPLGKDLIRLERLTADQIRGILDTADPFKEISERAIKKVPVLRGKTIVNLFFEASTRTRISFEFAEKRLSADTVNIAPGERYSVLVNPTAGDVGAWAWHCHILTHAEGDQGLMGMVKAFVVPDPAAP